jgi:hypothetical protein
VPATLAIDWILSAAAALGLIWMLVPLLMASIGWRPVLNVTLRQQALKRHGLG